MAQSPSPCTVDYPRSTDDLLRSLQRAYERLNALQTSVNGLSSTSSASIPTMTTTQTPGAAYTANEQAMLLSLKTDIANVIAALAALKPSS